MSFIDEAAREIHVKIVWYSAAPRMASALVRLIGARTRPELKQEQTLALGGSFTVTHLRFAPATKEKLRGYSTQFHLYAIESESGEVEPDDVRLLVFRGADACAFIGGDGEAEALTRVDTIFATQGYTNLPSVFGTEANDAVARGRALGFPSSDSFVLDSQTGAGVFEAFKLIAKKILATLAGQSVTGRATPAAGAVPLTIDSNAPRAAKTLDETQVGLDEWQRAYHAKAIWVVGCEETRLTPRDVPADLPTHTVHVIRRLSGEGFAVMSNGLSRDPCSRLELRADTSRHGWQIAMTVSFLGRLACRQALRGERPWLEFDVVTTAEAPIFGLKHFVLAPAGSVRVNDEAVTILRPVPISTDEHRDVSTRKPTGEQMATWLAERSTTMLHRWLSTLEHEQPFGEGAPGGGHR